MEIAAPAVLVRKHVPVAGGDGCSRRRNRQCEQRSSEGIAGFAPIEARVRDHNFNSGDKEGKKTQRGDPMSDTHKGRVARSSRGDGSGRSRTWDGCAQRCRHGFYSRHLASLQRLGFACPRVAPY